MADLVSLMKTLAPIELWVIILGGITSFLIMEYSDRKRQRDEKQILLTRPPTVKEIARAQRRLLLPTKLYRHGQILVYAPTDMNNCFIVGVYWMYSPRNRKWHQKAKAVFQKHDRKHTHWFKKYAKKPFIPTYLTS